MPNLALMYQTDSCHAHAFTVFRQLQGSRSRPMLPERCRCLRGLGQLAAVDPGNAAQANGPRASTAGGFLPAHTQPLPEMIKCWFVYLVRAENGSLYCGISDDPLRRFTQHRSGKGARFFYSSPAQALVYVEACADKPSALRRELAIKRLTKSAKEVLVSSTPSISLIGADKSGCIAIIGRDA